MDAQERILDLLEKGKVSVGEATELLKTLCEGDAAAKGGACNCRCCKCGCRCCKCGCCGCKCGCRS